MNLKNYGILIICFYIICSCSGGGRHDAEFQRIDRLCDSIPEEAIRALNSIDPSSLSGKDLYRFDLLSIKSRDKAFIAHTSDSLILDIIDYYDKHRSEGLYAEALYYGGRVYSDIGDLPTALEFFQKSLDEIPEDNEHLRFRSTVLNQTGRLLLNLRLDSEAIKYLEESLGINANLLDTSSNVPFTHGLISGAYIGLHDLKKAHKHMDLAISFTPQMSKGDSLTLLTEYADLLHNEDKIDSALTIIRPLPSMVDSITKSFCLAVAAEIYRDAGIADTAYKYARELTKLDAQDSKRTGYKVIFSNELKDYISRDTLMKLIPEYKQAVEDYLNTHEADQAIIQNSRYNYSIHIKQREEAEKKLNSLHKRLWLAAASIIILLLIYSSIIFRRKYKSSKNDSQILEGIMLADKLKENPSLSFSHSDQDSMMMQISMEELQEKQRILDEIKNAKKMNPSESVDKNLTESTIYKDLKEKAENKRVMGKDVTWRMIHDLIESASPGFDNKLTILTQSKITISERNVAYLMKFGFTQIQMASLLAKDSSTISAQRTSLAKKIGYDKSAIAAIIVRL